MVDRRGAEHEMACVEDAGRKAIVRGGKLQRIESGFEISDMIGVSAFGRSENEYVGIRTAGQHIQAGASCQRIVSGISGKAVSALTAEKIVVAVSTSQGVVSVTELIDC